MKKLLFAVMFLMFLPKAHGCTVTLTPATSTLQTGQNESVTATLSGSGCGSTTTWSLSCSPSGNCGSLSSKTRNGATYNAPTTPPSGSVAVTVTATNGSSCSGTGCAAVTIKVPTGLTVTPANSSIYLGNTQTMSATENFSDGSTQPGVAATFTTSNSSVASVSGSTVTSVNFSAIPGPVTIGASYTDPQTSGAVTGNTTLAVTPAVQINALTLASGSPSGVVSAYQSNVLGSSYVWGVNPYMIWNTVESSSGSGSGGYDFTSFDASLVGSSGSIFPSGPPTKKINIIVVPVSGGCAIGNGSGDTNCGNTATPSYVLGNVPTPLTCTSYPGNGGSGSTNGGFPEVFNTNFQGPYENFIAAVLKHYSSACDSTTEPCNSTQGPNGANGPALAPYLGYIRFGLSAGGEVYPFCASGNYSVDSGTDQWADYIQTMSDYIVSTEETYVSDQQAVGGNIQLMTSINQNKGPVDFTIADDEAGYAYAAKETSPSVVTMGFGSQGLQKSDVANYQTNTTCTSSSSCPCTSDWCTMFSSYTGDVPLELQTVLQSDPNDSSSFQTGSLCKLIPFATYLHTNILELYAWDLLYAYDSGFCTLSGAPGNNNNNPPLTDYCSGGASLYNDAYQTAISNAVSGVSGSSNPSACTAD